MSVGAARRRLVAQLLTECLALAVAGGLLGVLLAWAGMEAILTVVPPFTIPDESEVRIHLPVLAFSMGVTMLTALIFGLGPALASTRTNLAEMLRVGGRGVVALLLVAVGAAACWLPARRAGRVDPMSALRFD